MAEDDIHITCPKCYADVLVETLTGVPLDEKSVVNCDGCGKELKVLKRLQAKEKVLRRADRREQAARRREEEAERFNRDAEAFVRAARHRQPTNEEVGKSKPESGNYREAFHRASQSVREDFKEHEARQQRDWEAIDPDDPKALREALGGSLALLAFFCFVFPIAAPVVAAVLISGSRLPARLAARAATSMMQWAFFGMCLWMAALGSLF